MKTVGTALFALTGAVFFMIGCYLLVELEDKDGNISIFIGCVFLFISHVVAICITKELASNGRPVAISSLQKNMVYQVECASNDIAILRMPNGKQIACAIDFKIESTMVTRSGDFLIPFPKQLKKVSK